MKKVLIRTTLAGFLLVTAPVTSVMASGETEEWKKGEQFSIPNTTEEINKEIEMEVQEGVSILEESENEEVTLLPTNFFYFVKTFIEKLQLAITMDDKKEAELILTIANKRILEAEALLKDGNNELAEETLQRGLELIEELQDKLDDIDNENGEQDSTNEEEVDMENKENEVEEENNEEGKEEKEVIEVKLSQNILSLAKNYKKIDNEKAKAALKSNIERAYDRLISKYPEHEEVLGIQLAELLEENGYVDEEHREIAEQFLEETTEEVAHEEEEVIKEEESVLPPKQNNKSTENKVDQKEVVKEKKNEKKQEAKANKNEQKQNKGQGHNSEKQKVKEKKIKENNSNNGKGSNNKGKENNNSNKDKKKQNGKENDKGRN